MFPKARGEKPTRNENNLGRSSCRSAKSVVSRLKQIKAGKYNDLDSLLDLNYTYDAAGNITQIVDNKVTSGTPPVSQTQTFTYDTLNRIVSGGADGTTGSYSESYTYNASTGNLAS